MILRRERITALTASKVLVVWAHPRTDSLTATVASDVRDELSRAGFEIDELDLYREGFDPILREPDEPDWDDLDKRYTADVMEHIARSRDARAVVFVFPIWWYALPAIMKGYVDRVWNHGQYYGDGRHSGVEAVLWLGLAGETETTFRTQKYDEMMARMLNVATANFCGIADSRLELLYNTLGIEIDDMAAHVAELRDTARRSVRELVHA